MTHQYSRKFTIKVIRNRVATSGYAVKIGVSVNDSTKWKAVRKMKEHWSHVKVCRKAWGQEVGFSEDHILSIHINQK